MGATVAPRPDRAEAGNAEALVRLRLLSTTPGARPPPTAQSALEQLTIGGDVLELACGTGWWTRHLARRAAAVTAIDASQAMLDINRRRVASGNVRYVAADHSRWVPDQTYDAIFFAFWLSHVPASRFESFWRTVESALAPSGQVAFVDEHAASATRAQEDWTGR